MLPLLQKKLSRKQQLELQVIGFVVVLHLIALFLFFFTGHHDTLSTSITLHATQRDGMKIVFLPWYTSMPTASTAVSVQPAQPAQAKKVAAKPVPKPVAKQVKAPAKKPATQITKTSPKPVAKIQPKKVVPPPVKTVAALAPPKPIESPKAEPVRKADAVPQVAEAPKVTASAETELPSHMSLGTEDVLYVGQQERALLYVQEHLQAELARCWKAPTTIKGNLSCNLLVKIDRGGKAASVSIVKSSGAKLYDMLAQKAFRGINYPRQIWGKDITFTFKGQ